MQTDGDIDPRRTGDTRSREHEPPANSGEPADIEPPSDPRLNEELEQAVDDGWIAELLSQQATTARTVYPAVKPGLSSELAEALWKTEHITKTPLAPPLMRDSLSATDEVPPRTLATDPPVESPVHSPPNIAPVTFDGTEKTPPADSVNREDASAQSPVLDEAVDANAGVMANSPPMDASPIPESETEPELMDNSSIENLFAEFSAEAETPVVETEGAEVSEEPASTESSSAAIDQSSIDALLQEEGSETSSPGSADSSSEPELMDNSSIENLFAEFAAEAESPVDARENDTATPTAEIESAEMEDLRWQDSDDVGEEKGPSNDSRDDIEEVVIDEPTAVDPGTIDTLPREGDEPVSANPGAVDDKATPPADDLDTLDELLDSVRMGGLESSEEQKPETPPMPKAPPHAESVSEMALTESGSLDPAMIERLLNEQTSDASGAVDPAIIESLLHKTRREPEVPSDSAMESMASVEQSLESLLSEDSDSADEKELSAPPPARPPSRVGEPKIDFAALRRAKSMDSAQVKATVGRIFGEKEDPESQSEVSISVPDVPTEGQDPGPDLDGSEGRITLRLPAGFTSLSTVVETVHGWFRRMDPTVLEIAGWMGLFLGVNGILILVLAILGWI